MHCAPFQEFVEIIFKFSADLDVRKWRWMGEVDRGGGRGEVDMGRRTGGGGWGGDRGVGGQGRWGHRLDRGWAMTHTGSAQVVTGHLLPGPTCTTVHHQHFGSPCNGLSFKIKHLTPHPPLS